MIIIAGINFTYSLSVVLISYTLIVVAVLHMRSADGRRKAFSTCGSHLTAVTMFYGALLFMYLRRPTEESVEQGKMVAVFYTTVIPMLNPMILQFEDQRCERGDQQSKRQGKLEAVNLQYLIPCMLLPAINVQAYKFPV